MTTPFRGTINLDDRDSVPDWDALHAAGGARGRAERPVHRARRRRVLGHGAVGRADRDAEHHAARRDGAHLHQLAHDRAVLADPLVAADRPQPHDQRHGLHRRGHHRLPQRQRPHPVRVRHDRRGPRRARLEHVHARQVAPGRRRRDEHGLDQAQLAHRPGLRALLRLPRRRDEPVVSGPGLRQPPGRPAVHARGGLPPHDRPHRQGDRVHQGRQGHRARQAVLHVLLPGGHPRAPPRAQGVDRRSTRASSTWATSATASWCSSGRRRWASSPADAELSPLNPYADETSVDGKPWNAVDVVRPWDSLSDGRAAACSPAWPRCTPGS